MSAVYIYVLLLLTAFHLTRSAANTLSSLVLELNGNKLAYIDGETASDIK